MSALKSLVAKLLGANSRLSVSERMVLDCVRDQLGVAIAKLWDSQVGAINKVQRLPEGAEVNFYRMTKGRPSFDAALAFPNKTAELLIAKVRIECIDMQRSLTAKIWSVNGFLFSIEYDCSANYFEEATGMDPRPTFTLACELIADLTAMTKEY